MKKTVSILCASAMVFSLAACGATRTESDTATTNTDNSGGIQTTGGATTNASDLTVETSGNSAAAIRSDRGGGTVNVDGDSYTSNGYNSPAVDNNAIVTIDSGCTWTLTGDCTITSLTNNGTINFNGYTITLADGTVLS